MPTASLNSNQFGFRKGCGTSFGIGLLNGVLSHYKYSKTPMFMCGLDAERCFDSLWHDGPFFKLKKFLPDIVWRFLYNLYRNLTAIVKLNGHIYSNLIFNVTRGTRVYSPLFYSICFYLNYCMNLMVLIMAYVWESAIQLVFIRG